MAGKREWEHQGINKTFFRIAKYPGNAWENIKV